MKDNIELYYDKCLEYMKKIKNPILKECCKEIYENYKEKLVNKPATTGSHHFYRGGLLFHIYCVTRNSVAICNLYPDLEIDLDLIIFGGLLHDIGKTNDFFDFDDENNFKNKGNSAALLGHSYEGTYIVENYLNRYNIDEQFKNQVLHTIGSHMNEYSEYGALVMPKMLEAIIINFADNMDAHLEPGHQIIKHANKGELYKISNAPRNYYKSLNPFYNLERQT